jgi:hypothetical protein
MCFRRTNNDYTPQTLSSTLYILNPILCGPAGKQEDVAAERSRVTEARLALCASVPVENLLAMLQTTPTGAPLVTLRSR